jgi:hypothetical protein
MEPKTYFQEPYLFSFETTSPTDFIKFPETQGIQTLLPAPLLDGSYVNPFSTPAISDKITISTTVYDEFGDPLPGANIHIDGKPIASTYNNGTVTVPGIATSTSIIKITYVGMKDYSISAVFLPKKVMMEIKAIELDVVTITIPKKPIITTPSTIVPLTPVVAKAGMSWVMWLLLLGGVYKGMQYFKDEKPKTVKAKI